MAFEALAFPIRIVQFIFAIIVLGTTASVVHTEQNPYLFSDTAGASGYLIPGNESKIDFLLFTACWSILVLFYIIPATTTFGSIHHPVAVTVLEALTTLFYFAGFIAVAYEYRNTADNLFQGVDGNGNVIEFNYPAFFRTAEAAAAFGAFNWLLFLITTVFSGLSMGGSRRTTKTTTTTTGPTTNTV